MVRAFARSTAKRSPGDDSQPAIYIKVYPGDDFEIDGTHYNIEEAERVYGYVNERIQRNPNKPVILHTDREASYGNMIAIMNQLRKLEKDTNINLALTIPTRSEAELYREHL